MENQLTNNANALRLFFTEEVFLVEDKTVKIEREAVIEPVLPLSVDENKTDEIVEKIASFDENKPVETKKYLESTEILPVVEEPMAAKSFKFLGGNQKSVLILVNDQAFDVSSEQGRELLRKIVKAIDLNTPDFALVNYAGYQGTSFTELHGFFQPQLMLAFGVEAGHLNLNLTWQNEIILYQTTRMIFAPNLHLLDTDTPSKKALWANLQKIK
jgi:DNA polymerase III psi subunit